MSDGEELMDEARDEAEVQLFAAERLAFFTDAVAAIAITLLALNLQIPQADSWATLGHGIAQVADGYLAFLISFLIIGNAWLSHHALFGYVKRADRRLMQLNLLWLLGVVLAPYFTKMVVDNGVFFEFRFVSYALLQVLLAMIMWGMVRHARRAGLLLLSTPPDAMTRIVIRSLVVAIPFGLSVPIVFVPGVGDAAYIVWYAGPTLTGLAFHVRRRLSGR